jgi:geranylgeranyl reductase family protein
MYDVVVVGGGPAGSTAGTILAGKGLSVAILDAEGFPRDKPCGGYISASCAATIRQVYGQPFLDQVSVARSADWLLLLNYGLVANVCGGDTGHFVKRLHMDGALAGLASAAGCTILETAKVMHVDPDQATATLSSGQQIRGRVLIGADGVGSVVRKAIRPAGTGGHRGMAVGMVAAVPAERIRPQACWSRAVAAPAIFFGNVPWGYGWIFPNGPAASIGVGGLVSKNRGIKASWEAFIRRTCVPGTLEALRPQAGLLPFGNFDPCPGKETVLLIGDAAGMADPVTGEGIGFAFLSAALAAEAVAAGLAAGSPRSAVLRYIFAYSRHILPRLRQAWWARWLLYPGPCLPAAMRALKRKPHLARGYMQVVSGTKTHVQYLQNLFAEHWLRR